MITASGNCLCFAIMLLTMKKKYSALVLVLTTSIVSGATQNWQQAIQSNDLPTLYALLDTIPDPERATKQGKNALMAAAFKADTQLVQRLLHLGVDPNLTNQSGGSALMYAVVGGSANIVEQLLHAGANPQQRSSNGWSPLMLAVAKQRAGLIPVLLQAGANSNTADVYGWTPLMRAVYEGYLEEARLLLAHPATNLERINDHGQTALHLAVIGQHPELVELLLDYQAQQRADFSGTTPQDIAQQLNNQQILSLFQHSIR